MENNAYVHPLSGPEGTEPERREPPRKEAALSRSYVAEFLCVALLLGLFAAVLYGYRSFKEVTALRQAIAGAQSTPEYEPLSHAGDGSYEGGATAKGRDVLKRLRGWRDRH